MVKEITLSGEEPIKINYNGGVDELLNPIHCSSVDLNIVNDRILSDIYQAKRDNIMIEINKKIYEYTKEQWIHHPEQIIHHPEEIVNQNHFFKPNNTIMNFKYLWYYKGVFHYNDLIWNSDEENWIVDEDVKRIKNNQYKLWNIDDKLFWFNSQIRYPYNILISMYVETEKDWVDFDLYIDDIYYPYTQLSSMLYSSFTLPFEMGGDYYIIHDEDWTMYKLQRVDYVNKRLYFYTSSNRLLNNQLIWNRAYENDLRFLYNNTYYRTGDVGEGEQSKKIFRLNNDGSETEITYRIKDENGNYIPLDNIMAISPFSTMNNLYFLLHEMKLVDTWVEKDYLLGIEEINNNEIIFNILNPDLSVDLSFVLDYSLLPDGVNRVYFHSYSNDKIYQFIEETLSFVDARFDYIIPAWDEIIPAWDEYIPSKREYKETIKLWEGYLTPNIFSQTTSRNLDEISATFIDTLSLLKYYKISDFFRKGEIVSVSEIINTILSRISITADRVYIQQQNILYKNEIPFVDLQVQIDNYWDENDDSENLYDVLSSVLRLFNKTIYYSKNTFYIMDPTNVMLNDTPVDSSFVVYNKYRLNPYSPMGDKSLIPIEDEDTGNPVGILRLEHTLENYKPINDGEISLDTTYSKISVRAETSTPKYKNDILDSVNYKDTEKYKILEKNVNTTLVPDYIPISNDEWQKTTEHINQYNHIFNGIYINEFFGLYTERENRGNNNLSDWLLVNNGEFGTILNFYGIAPNNSRKDKVGTQVNNIITAYTKDNGTVPEYLFSEDLSWISLTSFASPLKRDMNTNTRFGHEDHVSDYSDRCAFHQEIEDIIVNDELSQVINIDFSHRYSRTGFPTPLGMVASTNASPNHNPYELYPLSWLEENVKFNRSYYNNLYKKGHNMREKISWNKVKVQLVKQSTGEYLWFNGFDWVNTESYIWMGTLLNDKKIFQNDFRPSYITNIQPNDDMTFGTLPRPSVYSLSNNAIIVKYKDGKWEKYDESGEGELHIQRYSTSLSKYIQESSEGKLSILLPELGGEKVDVFVDFYCSTLLGKTGISAVQNDDSDIDYRYLGNDLDVTVYTDNNGVVRHYDNCDIYFIPISGTHIRAEHFKIGVEINCTAASLGQMFDKSDILYEMTNNENYFEELSLDDLLLNTPNELVNNSYSYVMYDNRYIQPYDFRITQGDEEYEYDSRPEDYMLMKHMNIFGYPRQRYKKTIKSIMDVMLFDLIDGNELEKSIIAGFSWDLKKGLYDIEAMEYYDINTIPENSILYKEIKHQPRSRYFK